MQPGKRILSAVFWARFFALLSTVFFLTVLGHFFFQGSSENWESGQFKCLDLYQHYAAGNLWDRTDPEPLYRGFQLGEWINHQMDLAGEMEEREPIESFNYVYPPLIAAIAAWGTHVPFSTWIYGWLGFNVLAYGLSGLLLIRCLDLKETNHMDLVVLAWIGFSSFYYAVIPGQNTVLSLLIAAASGFLLARQKPILAGIVFSCVFYKPQFMPFVGLTALLCGQWRFLAALIAGNMAWLTVGLTVCGWKTYLLWLESLGNMDTGSQFEKPGLNQSWRGLLLEINGESTLWIRLLSLVLPLLFCALVAWGWHRRTGIMSLRRLELPLFAALAVMLVSSPYIGHYDLLLGIPFWFAVFASGPTSPFTRAAQILFWFTAFLCGASMFLEFPLGALPLTLWVLVLLLKRPTRLVAHQ